MPAPTRRIAALDGIRGLAIILVVVYHDFWTTQDFPLGSVGADAMATLRLWWNGVDLFFVLSGFLIGGILIDARSSERYYSTFYARRAFRILPLYLSLLAAVGIAYLLGGIQPGELPAWSYVLLVQNIFTAVSGSYGTIWLDVTYTLAIEEHFYLVLPVVVRKTSVATLKKLALTCIIVMPLFRLAAFFALPNGAVAASALLVTRADVLMYGVGLAIVTRDPEAMRWVRKARPQLWMLAITSLLVLVVFTVKDWNFLSIEMVGVGYSVQALFFALIVLLVLDKEAGMMARLFSIFPLRYLGIRAYAIYLFHVPILVITFRLLRSSEPSVNNASSAAVALASALATVLIADATWRLVERPLISHGHKYRY